MRALIIDDVRLARAELRRLLTQHPEVEVVGEAASVPEGVSLIAQTRPDLVFLDIQMPGGSGFDLLAALDEAPTVIFTTAYDQYAIRAFDVNALDYLLKPIEPARLAQALQKCARQMQQQMEQTALQAKDKPQQRPQAADGKVFIKDGERCWFVALEQIALFESEGNYTRVHFDQQAPLMLRALAQLEARLDPAKFMRISRSQIVNLAFVTSIAPAPSGGLRLSLKGDLKVSMSRRRAAEFKQLNRL